MFRNKKSTILKLPTFLIIGAAKSATTSLHQYLDQHPEIFMSGIKEPNFFSFIDKVPDYEGPDEKTEYIKHAMFCKSIIHWEDYYNLFTEVTDEKAIGESSPSYLYIPEAAARIKQYIPNIKLIAVLRNPVDRAYSKFRESIRFGLEPLGQFEEALEAELNRIKNNWSPNWFYVNRGFYYRQLQRYYGIFSENQIRIYLYDDFNNDPQSTLKDIFGFLNVDDTFKPDISEKYNVSQPFVIETSTRWLRYVIRNRNPVKSLIKKVMTRKQIKHMRDLLQYLKIIKIKDNKIPEITEQVRSKLIGIFKEDILKLQDLIKRDLTHWLKF